MRPEPLGIAAPARVVGSRGQDEVVVLAEDDREPPDLEQLLGERRGRLRLAGSGLPGNGDEEAPALGVDGVDQVRRDLRCRAPVMSLDDQHVTLHA